MDNEIAALHQRINSLVREAHAATNASMGMADPHRATAGENRMIAKVRSGGLAAFTDLADDADSDPAPYR